jgi:hypothetical protein
MPPQWAVHFISDTLVGQFDWRQRDRHRPGLHPDRPGFPCRSVWELLKQPVDPDIARKEVNTRIRLILEPLDRANPFWGPIAAEKADASADATSTPRTNVDRRCRPSMTRASNPPLRPSSAIIKKLKTA